MIMSDKGHKTGNKKIGIVEDDGDLLFLLKKVLLKEGYKVDCFQDGSVIFNNHGYPWPDLFLLDKKTQFVYGLTICKFLRSNKATAEIPIIIMSGTSQFEKDAFQAGADYFLEKPIDINKFLTLLNSLLILPMTHRRYPDVEPQANRKHMERN